MPLKVTRAEAAELRTNVSTVKYDNPDDPFELTGVEQIVQRPNAVIKNGGPQLLRGLMLPLCPSSNRYWSSRAVPSKKMPGKYIVLTYPSTDAQKYIKHLGEIAIQRGFRFRTEKPLRMDVLVCPRDRREVDAHNYSKCLCDAMEQVGVYENDSQIQDLRERLGPVIKGGRMIVSLWETEPDRDALLKELWQ